MRIGRNPFGFGDVDFEEPVGHLGRGLRLIAEDKGWD